MKKFMLLLLTLLLIVFPLVFADRVIDDSVVIESLSITRIDEESNVIPSVIVETDLGDIIEVYDDGIIEFRKESQMNALQSLLFAVGLFPGATKEQALKGCAIMGGGTLYKRGSGQQFSYCVAQTSEDKKSCLSKGYGSPESCSAKLPSLPPSVRPIAKNNKCRDDMGKILGQCISGTECRAITNKKPNGLSFCEEKFIPENLPTNLADGSTCKDDFQCRSGKCFQIGSSEKRCEKPGSPKKRVDGKLAGYCGGQQDKNTGATICFIPKQYWKGGLLGGTEGDDTAVLPKTCCAGFPVCDDNLYSSIFRFRNIDDAYGLCREASASEIKSLQSTQLECIGNQCDVNGNRVCTTIKGTHKWYTRDEANKLISSLTGDWFCDSGGSPCRDKASICVSKKIKKATEEEAKIAKKAEENTKSNTRCKSLYRMRCKEYNLDDYKKTAKGKRGLIIHGKKDKDGNILKALACPDEPYSTTFSCCEAGTKDFIGNEIKPDNNGFGKSCVAIINGQPKCFADGSSYDVDNDKEREICIASSEGIWEEVIMGTNEPASSGSGDPITGGGSNTGCSDTLCGGVCGIFDCINSLGQSIGGECINNDWICPEGSSEVTSPTGTSKIGSSCSQDIDCGTGMICQDAKCIGIKINGGLQFSPLTQLAITRDEAKEKTNSELMRSICTDSEQCIVNSTCVRLSKLEAEEVLTKDQLVEKTSFWKNAFHDIAGCAAGATAASATGAAIGTLGFPVVGTAIGGAGGALVGCFIGSSTVIYVTEKQKEGITTENKDFFGLCIKEEKLFDFDLKGLCKATDWMKFLDRTGEGKCFIGWMIYIFGFLIIVRLLKG